MTPLKTEGRWSIQGMSSGRQHWAQRELDPSADPTFFQLCHLEQKGTLNGLPLCEMGVKWYLFHQGVEHS